MNKVKKIYESLRRKFGRRKDEHWNHIISIKDFERIQKYVKKIKKQNKPFWKKLFTS